MGLEHYWCMSCDECSDYLYPPDGDEAAYYKRKGILINAAESEGWEYYDELPVYDEDGDCIDTFEEACFCCEDCRIDFCQRVCDNADWYYIRHH